MARERTIEDAAAEAYAADPGLLEPTDNTSARLPERRGRLGGAVPIRFTPEMIERIKIAADEDQMSVSSWVRNEISESLDRREPKTTRLANVIRLRHVDPDAIRRQTSRALAHG